MSIFMYNGKDWLAAQWDKMPHDMKIIEPEVELEQSVEV